MSGGYDLSGYVDVASRIAAFSAKFPEGSLQSNLTFMEGGWLCKAYAYRSPTDERPGIGHAFEPVPGKTPYTRDSEAMNAETSAWGRAIVALGFETKHIASADEVNARASSDEEKSAFTPPAGAVKKGGISKPQMGKIGALVKELVDAEAMTIDDLRAFTKETFGKTSRAELTSKEASSLIEWLLNKQAGLVPVGAADGEDISF